MLVVIIGQAAETAPDSLLVKGYVRPAKCTDYLGFSSHRWPVEVRLFQRDVPLEITKGYADECGLLRVALNSRTDESQLRVEIMVQGDWAHSTYRARMAVEHPELDFGRIYMQKRF